MNKASEILHSSNVARSEVSTIWKVTLSPNPAAARRALSATRFIAWRHTFTNATTDATPGTRPECFIAQFHRGDTASGANGFQRRTWIPIRSALRHPCFLNRAARIEKGNATPQAANPFASRAGASSSATLRSAVPSRGLEVPPPLLVTVNPDTEDQVQVLPLGVLVCRRDLFAAGRRRGTPPRRCTPEPLFTTKARRIALI